MEALQSIDWNTLLNFVLVATVALAARYGIQWLRANTTHEQRLAIANAVDTLVQAAEQVYGPGEGREKLAQVKQWAVELDHDVSTPDIEAAVLRLRQSQGVFQRVPANDGDDQGGADESN